MGREWDLWTKGFSWNPDPAKRPPEPQFLVNNENDTLSPGVVVSGQGKGMNERQSGQCHLSVIFKTLLFQGVLILQEWLLLQVASSNQLPRPCLQ